MQPSLYNPLIKAEFGRQEKQSLGVIGHLAKDEIVHPDLGLRTLPGGSAAAVATASVQLGIRTSIHSKVGKDYPSEWLSVLDNLGVDISKVEVSEEKETLKVKIIYDENGETELIECSDVVSESLNIKTLPRTDSVHICPIQPPEQRELVQKLKGHCDILSISFSEYFIKDYNKEGFFDDSSLKDVDILFANDKVAHALTREDKPEDAASKLHSKDVDVVAITLGKNGSLVFDGKEVHTIAAMEVPVIDPTGGGDSYIGGFLGEYLISKDARKAGGMGTYLASLTVQKKGSWAALVSDVGIRF
jgi:sugar/nucleoside kinase (ribokinase family)